MDVLSRSIDRDCRKQRQRNNLFHLHIYFRFLNYLLLTLPPLLPLERDAPPEYPPPEKPLDELRYEEPLLYELLDELRYDELLEELLYEELLDELLYEEPEFPLP